MSPTFLVCSLIAPLAQQQQYWSIPSTSFYFPALLCGQTGSALTWTARFTYTALFYTSPCSTLPGTQVNTQKRSRNQGESCSVTTSQSTSSLSHFIWKAEKKREHEQECKTDRKKSSIRWLTPKCPHQAWSQKARMPSESLVGGRDISTWATTRCLPRCTFPGI